MSKCLFLGLIAALTVASAAANQSELANASVGAKGEPAIWAVWGGTAHIEWNRHLLSELNMELSEPVNRINSTAPGAEQFAIRESGGLEFRVRGIAFDGFTAGSLQLRGGL